MKLLILMFTQLIQMKLILMFTQLTRLIRTRRRRNNLTNRGTFCNMQGRLLDQVQFNFMVAKAMTSTIQSWLTTKICPSTIIRTNIWKTTMTWHTCNLSIEMSFV
ncbi:hypothetical protein ABFS82_09G045600 [Erythranthe guttata]